MADKYLVYTASTTITLPADWNPGNHTIWCMAGGGGGAAGDNGGGGNGGDCARSDNNCTQNPGTQVVIQVGGGGGSGPADGNAAWGGNSGVLNTSGGKYCYAIGGYPGTQGGPNGLNPTNISASGGGEAYNTSYWQGGRGTYCITDESSSSSG